MAPVDSSTSHTASNGRTVGGDASSEVHVHSINRVVDFPVVKSALGYASGFYSRVKGYNHTLESGFSVAEQTVQLVADSAKPVIQKLEKPSEYFFPVLLFRATLMHHLDHEFAFFLLLFLILLQSITRTR